MMYKLKDISVDTKALWLFSPHGCGRTARREQRLITSGEYRHVTCFLLLFLSLSLSLSLSPPPPTTFFSNSPLFVCKQISAGVYLLFVL